MVTVLQTWKDQVSDDPTKPVPNEGLILTSLPALYELHVAHADERHQLINYNVALALATMLEFYGPGSHAVEEVIPEYALAKKQMSEVHVFEGAAAKGYVTLIAQGTACGQSISLNATGQLEDPGTP